MKLTFGAPVTEHRFQLRCVPVTGPRQQVIDIAVQIEPRVELESTIDSFCSLVMTEYMPQAHTEFGYLVTGIAFVDNANIKEDPFKPLYRFQSELTKPGTAIGELVEQCRARLDALGEGVDELEPARQIMDAVYGAFEYTPGSTTVQTTAEEAFEQRKGVCQDYAHVMLSACRELGIPARYIAGLLGGEGATHAWVEVYHDRRWIGLDPTHDRMVDDNYITIAHGRDYRDCMLDIGVFSGNSVSQTQWVNASVHESLS